MDNNHKRGTVRLLPVNGGLVAQIVSFNSSSDEHLTYVYMYPGTNHVNDIWGATTNVFEAFVFVTLKELFEVFVKCQKDGYYITWQYIGEHGLGVDLLATQHHMMRMW